MSFCPYCGKELAEGENCTCEGAVKNAAENAAETVNETAETVTETVTEAVAEAEKKENAVADAAQKVVDKMPAEAQNFIKKNGRYIGIAAAALVLIIIICSVTGSSYKDPINEVVKTINKGSADKYIELQTAGMPSKLAKSTKNLFDLLDEDFYEDEIDDLADDFEDLSDKYSKWKIKFVMADKEKLSKSDLSDFADDYEDLWDDYLEDFVDNVEDLDEDDVEDLCDMLDIDAKDYMKYLKSVADYASDFKKVKISEGYKVKGYYVLKNGSDEIDKTDKVTMYVLKVNGEWVINSTKDGDRFRFDSGSKNYDKYSFLQNYLNNFYFTELKSLGSLY